MMEEQMAYYRSKYSIHDQYKITKQISEKFNGNVPDVTEKPRLEDYGLPSNIKDIIIEEEKKIESRLRRVYMLLGCTAIVCGCCLFNEIVLGGEIPWYGAAIPALIIGFPIVLCATDDMKKQAKKKVSITPIGQKYERYQDDVAAYIYWDTLNSLNFWMSLDGRQFEEAVAILYRKNGYNAEVCKMGGDGGIDISLEKDGVSIAVQCKAHKKPVGPAVARDLYGTMLHMGYDKGIIVSTNGFTKGVYECKW